MLRVTLTPENAAKIAAGLPKSTNSQTIAPAPPAETTEAQAEAPDGSPPLMGLLVDAALGAAVGGALGFVFGAARLGAAGGAAAAVGYRVLT